MSRKRTRAELEDRVRQLEAYQEAWHAIGQGLERQVFTSGEYAVELLGAERASGGVVIHDRNCLSWVEEWAGRALASGDPYMRDLVSKVRFHQTIAIKARCGNG